MENKLKKPEHLIDDLGLWDFLETEDIGDIYTRDQLLSMCEVEKLNNGYDESWVLVHFNDPWTNKREEVEIYGKYVVRADGKLGQLKNKEEAFDYFIDKYLKWQNQRLEKSLKRKQQQIDETCECGIDILLGSDKEKK